MEFVQQTANRWVAEDKADTYEVIGQGKERFACFKNRTIWFATAYVLRDAFRWCELEQRAQEWSSNNPENTLKNQSAWEQRRAKENEHRKRRQKKRKRPKLWRGK